MTVSSHERLFAYTAYKNIPFKPVCKYGVLLVDKIQRDHVLSLIQNYQIFSVHIKKC